MKSLVLAEKPSVARDIARVLHCSKTIHGGIEGETYIVTWGLGHLVTLADPEKYEERYKTWKMEDLPMMLVLSCGRNGRRRNHRQPTNGAR